MPNALPKWIRTRINVREARLRKLGFLSYREFLGSNTWAQTKARYRASDRPQGCGLCDEAENLHLHRMTYERVGAEELTDLVPLCPNCHRIVHELERRGEMGLDFAGLADARCALQNRREQAERYERRFAPIDRAVLPAQIQQRRENVERKLRWALEHVADPDALMAGVARTIRDSCANPQSIKCLDRIIAECST